MEWKPIEHKVIQYNGNKYNIYEENGDYDGRIEVNGNTIAVDGKTYNGTRENKYEDEEYGYVVEVTRTEQENVFTLDEVWLVVYGMGWGETETIEDKAEIEYIKEILKQVDIELIIK